MVLRTQTAQNPTPPRFKTQNKLNAQHGGSEKKFQSAHHQEIFTSKREDCGDTLCIILISIIQKTINHNSKP